MDPKDEEDRRRITGLDRRDLLKRTAVVTGAALAWSAPTVHSLASPAFAAGSPLCETRIETEDCTIVYDDTPDCCECVESHPGLSLAEALALCADAGVCAATLEVCGEQEEEPEPEPPKSPQPPGGREVAVPTVVEGGK